MNTGDKNHSQADTEQRLHDLQCRLTEAEDMLQAIRAGHVDALLIGDDGNEQVFTLTGADQPYRMMIEQMQEGALTLAEDAVIIYCNRRFANLVNMPIHKLLGVHFASLFHHNDGPGVREFLENVRCGKAHHECALTTPNGPIPVLLSACPFEIGGHTNLCLTVTNLGDLAAARRESRELKEFNQELETKVAERTALLESQAQRLRMLAVQLTDAEQRERKRLAELIHDHLQQLLVAAKMRLDRLGRDHPSGGIHDVQRLLQESLDCARSLTTELRPPVLYEDGLGAALQWLSQHTKAQYDVEVATCLDPRVEPADESVRAFLYQAVRELVFNAIKHAGVTELRIVAEPMDSDRICIVVEDEGAGFDTNALRDRQTANESIGLFSIQERITALGGRMSVISERHIGTRVVLEVPQKPPENMPVKSVRRRARQVAGPPKSEGIAVRVMLVDDHQLVREGIGNLLKEHHEIFVVGTAENGQEAVAKAAELRPDVILMDANMPLMNGIEATRAVLGQFPEIHVVGLSVQSDEALRESFRQAGATAFLSKDGDIHCLFETILNCRAAAKT